MRSGSPDSMSFTKSYDETTPLLSREPTEDPKAVKVNATPVPKMQLGGEFDCLMQTLSQLKIASQL